MTKVSKNLITSVDPGQITDSMMFRNRIINGGMRIWQRGTSFSGITPTLGVTAYTADRWFVSQLGSQSSTDVTQQTTGAQKYSIRVQKRSGSTGSSQNQLGQVIENLNCLDIVGQTLTLSFTAKAGANYSAASNNLTVYVATCTAADSSSISFINGTSTGYSLIKVQQVQLTTSNQSFTISGISIPSNATNVAVWFEEASSASAAGANDWFEISNVQLEKGSTATPFEFRPYGAELALCQRYYETTGGTASTAFPAYFPRSFRVTKRAIPTLALIVGSDAGATFSNGADALNNFVWPAGVIATSVADGIFSANSEL